MLLKDKITKETKVKFKRKGDFVIITNDLNPDYIQLSKIRCRQKPVKNQSKTSARERVEYSDNT